MDITRKLDYAMQSVNGIARHDDEDSVVRKAALARLAQHIEAEQKAIDDRLQSRIAAQAGAEPSA